MKKKTRALALSLALMTALACDAAENPDEAANPEPGTTPAATRPAGAGGGAPEPGMGRDSVTGAARMGTDSPTGVRDSVPADSARPR